MLVRVRVGTYRNTVKGISLIKEKSDGSPHEELILFGKEQSNIDVTFEEPIEAD